MQRIIKVDQLVPARFGLYNISWLLRWRGLERLVHDDNVLALAFVALPGFDPRWRGSQSISFLLGCASRRGGSRATIRERP
jgi:hypothetical protein